MRRHVYIVSDAGEESLGTVEDVLSICECSDPSDSQWLASVVSGIISEMVFGSLDDCSETLKIEIRSE